MRAVALVLATVAVLATPPPSLAAERWAWPVRGEVLNPYRNGGDPYAARQHRGIDIGAAVGTAVTAATDGSITFAGSAGSSGLTVSMRTADGRFHLSYLHLSALSVTQGDQIAVGQRVGAVGTSGTRSDPRPHLHFGVRDAAKQHGYLDPLGLLPAPGAPSQPESPRAVPVPAPVPARPAPAPAPVIVPLPGGAPAPRRAPRSLPAPSRRPRPAGKRSPARPPSAVRRPLPLPSARPLGHPLPLPRAAPAGSRRVLPRPDRVRAPADGRSFRRSPAQAKGEARPSPALDQRSRASATPKRAKPSAPPRDVASRAGGPDLGWLLACLGVGTAALLLARPWAATRLPALARATAEALKRPLFGPR